MIPEIYPSQAYPLEKTASSSACDSQGKDSNWLFGWGEVYTKTKSWGQESGQLLYEKTLKNY